MIAKIIGGSLVAIGLLYGGYKLGFDSGHETGYREGHEVGYKEGREEVKVEANKRLQRAYDVSKDILMQYNDKLKVVLEDLETQSMGLIEKDRLENRVE